MMKVFIGGSRGITRLNAEVRERLDQIIRKQIVVLVGDANGADKAVQSYFHERGYDRVEVFCTGERCRNNLGCWKVTTVPAPHAHRNFEFYEAKDRKMTEESSLGLMLWDGKSKGTLSNVHRLLDLGKKVVVWVEPEKKFKTLKTRDDWRQFASHEVASLEPSWVQNLLWK
jgi:hypothetical protein